MIKPVGIYIDSPRFEKLNNEAGAFLFRNRKDGSFDWIQYQTGIGNLRLGLGFEKGGQEEQHDYLRLIWTKLHHVDSDGESEYLPGKFFVDTMEVSKPLTTLKGNTERIELLITLPATAHESSIVTIPLAITRDRNNCIRRVECNDVVFTMANQQQLDRMLSEKKTYASLKNKYSRDVLLSYVETCFRFDTRNSISNQENLSTQHKYLVLAINAYYESGDGAACNDLLVIIDKMNISEELRAKLKNACTFALEDKYWTGVYLYLQSQALSKFSVPNAFAESSNIELNNGIDAAIAEVYLDHMTDLESIGIITRQEFRKLELFNKARLIAPEVDELRPKRDCYELISQKINQRIQQLKDYIVSFDVYGVVYKINKISPAHEDVTDSKNIVSVVISGQKSLTLFERWQQFRLVEIYDIPESDESDEIQTSILDEETMSGQIYYVKNEHTPKHLYLHNSTIAFDVSKVKMWFRQEASRNSKKTVDRTLLRFIEEILRVCSLPSNTVVEVSLHDLRYNYQGIAGNGVPPHFNSDVVLTH